VQIVAPVAGRRFVGLSVTPDGNYVDFVVSGPRDLGRVAFLGGTPRLIASDVWSATGWSADGKHFAFVRADGTGASDSVIVADADGTNQRVLATRGTPQRFLSDSRTDRPIARPSWSADGATLLVLGFSAPPRASQVQELITLEATTGAARRTLPLPGTTALEAAWVDATHAIINHREGAREPQLSLCDLTTGSLSPVTQNLTAFRGVSLTGNRLAAVSTRLDQRSGIWIGGASGAAMVEAIPESAGVRGSVFIDNQDGIVYEMATAAGSGIYARARGAGQPKLVVDDASPNALTSDGRIVVFRRNDAIWKVNVDGSGLARLAAGMGAAQPVLMRDDTTVVFLSTNSGLQSLWTAALDGGPAREVAHRFASRPAVSFDGRHLLFVSNNATGQLVTVLCDLPDCTNQRETANITGAWTPDGRSIAYVDSADPKNIYLQPVGGGASRRLTQFTEKNILDFDWSADGKRLAITRGSTLADMVLIRGFP
jgi:Tol biopolymer transport system component